MNMDEAGLQAVVQLVRAVARAEIMPRFRKLGVEDVQAKSGPLDLVTVADEAAEEQLSKGLSRLFEGCAIVGEEAASRDGALLDRIETAALCFVVDPIDGTFNYASGLPLFGVMVAVVEHGETVGAVIHDPVGDDTALALAGEGAWMQTAEGGRTVLRVAAPAGLSGLSGSVSWRYMPEPRRSHVVARLPRVAASSDYRCAAHQYRMLAGGHYHYSVYNRLLPWDHAAGILLHREAGGYSALLDGTAYRPGSTEGGLICAPDRGCWQLLYDGLFGA